MTHALDVMDRRETNLVMFQSLTDLLENKFNQVLAKTTANSNNTHLSSEDVYMSHTWLLMPCMGHTPLEGRPGTSCVMVRVWSHMVTFWRKACQ
jgi:hypothetical protein